MSKTALIEVVKSFLRFMYFGILALIGTFLTSLLADPSLANTTITVAGQTFSIGFVIIGGLGLLVKAIDKYVRANPANTKNGIAPKFLQK